jgi:hypothetical protein
VSVAPPVTGFENDLPSNFSNENANSSSKPPISGMVGGLGDLAGGIMQFIQQNNANNAITQTGDQLQTDLGALTGEGGNLFNSYAGNAQPELNRQISTLPSAISGYQGGAASGYGSEAGYGSALGASPYPGLVMGAGSGAEGSELANASTLENWHGIQPKELGEATTVASDAAESAANTMKAQMGGVANPGAAFEEATNQAAQAGMQTGAQLGSMAEQQELGAKEAAGQEYGAVAWQQIGQAEGAGQLYQGAEEGAGELSGAAAGGLAGLSAQDINELESALSEEGTMASTGMGAQEYGASDWTSLLEQELGNQSAQSGNNPFSGIASGVMGILPLLGMAA